MAVPFWTAIYVENAKSDAPPIASAPHIPEKLDQFDVITDIDAAWQPTKGSPKIVRLPTTNSYLCHIPQCYYHLSNIKAIQ
jgi:hypothetical protein